MQRLKERGDGNVRPRRAGGMVAAVEPMAMDEGNAVKQKSPKKTVVAPQSPPRADAVKRRTRAQANE
jgi:hypothetical protein